MENAPSRLSAFLLVALLVAGAACSRGSDRASGALSPTPLPASATARPPLSTHSGPLFRATLPPTWTPTFTPTPTLTPTSTPVTPTPTLTPIPALADVCAAFVVNASIPLGYPFAWDDKLTLLLGTPLTAARDPATGIVDSALTVRFLATNLLTGRNQGIELSGGQVAIVELPLNKLPEPGIYTWMIAVYGDTLGERCVQRGLFFVAAPTAAATPTVAP